MSLLIDGQAKPQQLPSLTGIRGAAALWVVVFHIGQGLPFWSILPTLYSFTFVSNGFRGVDLFFVLSGFIMMHVHARDFVTLNSAAIRKFALMRVVRIYPANFVTLLLILAVVVACPEYVRWFRSWTSLIPLESYTPLSFVQTATLSSRWLIPDFGLWNVVTWSLSVELLAYFTLPPLAFLLLRVRSAGLCILISLASLAGMLGLLLLFRNWDGDSVTRLGLLRGFGGFIAGAAMRRCVSLARWDARVPAWLAIASIVAISVLLLLPKFAILMPFAFTALIAALSFQRGVIDAILRSRFFVFAGQISFSLYLLHYTVLLLMEWLFVSNQVAYTPVNIVVGLVAYLLTILVLSLGLHYWVERPCQRIGHRLVRRMDGPSLEPSLTGLKNRFP